MFRCNFLRLYEIHRETQLPFTQGAANARNFAINKSIGRYIAFLDSDDVWSELKLERQISFMIETSIAFSFTAYQFMSEDGKELLNIINAPSLMTYHSYLKNTIIGCLTVVLDRKQVGDFEMLNIRSSHDMALWLLIMRRGFYAYGLDENLAKYRVVSSSNTANKIEAAKEVWHVYRYVEGLNMFYSAICFVSYVFHAIKKRL